MKLAYAIGSAGAILGILAACGTEDPTGQGTTGTLEPVVVTSLSAERTIGSASSESPASADYDDDLVYEIPGVDPALRVGDPRPADEVVTALIDVRQLYGGVGVGDIYVDDGSIDFDTIYNLPFVPVGRTFGGEDNYIIGWVDQRLNRNWSSEDGLMPIAFVYNDDGVAIGSVPFPDEFPQSFPLPPDLEAMRYLLES